MSTTSYCTKALLPCQLNDPTLSEQIAVSCSDWMESLFNSSDAICHCQEQISQNPSAKRENGGIRTPTDAIHISLRGRVKNNAHIGLQISELDAVSQRGQPFPRQPPGASYSCTSCCPIGCQPHNI